MRISGKSGFQIVLCKGLSLEKYIILLPHSTLYPLKINSNLGGSSESSLAPIIRIRRV